MNKFKLVVCGFTFAACLVGVVSALNSGCTTTNGSTTLDTNAIAQIDQLAQQVISQLPAATSNALAVAQTVQQIQAIAHGSNAPAK